MTHEELVKKVMADTLAHQQEHKAFIRSCIWERLNRSTDEELQQCLPNTVEGAHAHDWKLLVGVQELVIGLVILLVLEQALLNLTPEPVTLMLQALFLALIDAGLTTCKICGKSLPILLLAKLQKR
jgi:hypothetical protein